MVRQVTVLPHDPAWGALYETEAATLSRLLGDELVAIHHIGSTSIPGLSAKPIVDIMVEVRSVAAVDRLEPEFVALGYVAKGENGIPGRRYFRKGTGDLHTHHVHIFQAGDRQVARHLAFRDYMIAHPDEAQAYGRLKEELAQRFPEDIDAYIDGKDAFVQERERRALAWSRKNSLSLTLEPMRPGDWPAVRAIYEEGIAGGQATLEMSAPDWPEWDRRHRPDCRLVAREGGTIVAWAALSPASSRQVYAGVAEVSIYVASSAQGRGIGSALLRALVAESERQGVWTLQAGIFAENAASLAIHRRCGFRVVGRRMRLGQLHGVWKDVVLMERRSAVVGV